MAARSCPDCGSETDSEFCPKCGLRTLLAPTPDVEGDPNLGRILEGRYRIEAMIGRGGMGTVYRGTQLATGQTVAIKIIRPEHASDADAARRFQREARAASRLTHPHTVRVVDFGQAEDRGLFLVLEYLAGRTLAQLLSQTGALPEHRIAKIACEVAQSLSESHAIGIAHRDLKPHNVMLVDTVGDVDFVKVLDFGVAKVLSGSSGESNVTRTGSVVGTPHYMAPEQASSKDRITPAVDIYSLGIIIHEALTGKKPFDGDSAIGILMAHVREPVPELPDDLPVSSDLRMLLSRMLSKTPDRRPAATELVRSFDALRLGLSVPEFRADTSSPARPQTLVDVVPPAEVLDLPPTTPGEDALARMAKARQTSPESTPVSLRSGEADVQKTQVLEPGRWSPDDRASDGNEPEPLEVPSWNARRTAFVLLALAVVIGAGILLARQFAGFAIDSPSETPPVTAPEAEPASPPERFGLSVLREVAAGPTSPSPALIDAQDSQEPRPVSLRVRFESKPAGATVSENGVDIGVTPVEADLAGPPGVRTFQFRLERHVELTLRSEVTPGSVMKATLAPVPVGKSAARRHRQAAEPRTRDGGRAAPDDDLPALRIDSPGGRTR